MGGLRSAALSPLTSRLRAEIAPVAAKCGIAGVLRGSHRRRRRRFGRAAAVHIDPGIANIPVALNDLVVHAAGIDVSRVPMDAIVTSQITVIDNPVRHTAVGADILKAVIHINAIEMDIRTREGNPSSPLRPAVIINAAMTPVEVDI